MIGDPREHLAQVRFGIESRSLLLRFGPAAAKRALAVLEMQVYVKPAGAKGEWLTTELLPWNLAVELVGKSRCGA